MTSSDRTSTARSILPPTVLVAGCSSRLVTSCAPAAEAVRCVLRVTTLDVFNTVLAASRPLVIVLPAAEYEAHRAEYDERAQDVAGCIVPVSNDRIHPDELEGLFMAAVVEAQRRRSR